MRLIHCNKFLLIALLTFLIGFIGCSDDEEPTIEEEEEEVELSVNATEFVFAAEGGTETLEVTSNGKWTIEYDNTLWAKPSITTTRGDATVTIATNENESTASRNMIFTITAEGADDVEITINQQGREPDPVNPGEMRDITSLELAQEMGIGWNLGNSLEAINVSGNAYTGGETAWGNPVVNKQLIDAVKAAGFNTVRIPVSWSHKFVDETTYEISEEWMMRVEEVANYVLDNDMYAIINIHWDGGWMNHPDYENQEEINAKLAAMWQQIAVYFQDYGDHLLFAGTNEVHVENNYGAPTAENAEVQNSFNQTFVNTVRATGGNNTYRHLVVQSYNTNIEHGVNYMTIPEDETDDRLMVEVHFYDPYQFTLDEGDGAAEVWGEEYQGHDAHSGWGDESWIDEAFGQVKSTFVDNGYPVVLGEYGALLRTEPDGVSYEEHVEARNYYLHYVTETALTYGLVPVYWDNGYTGNNGFGLFKRASGEIAYPNAVEAIISAQD